MAEQFEHRPVMESEVVDLLGPVPPGLIVDGTVGGGGHAGAILRARPDLRLLGIDRDPAAVAAAGAALAPFGERARIVQGGFEGVADIVGSERSEGVVGILFDLGVSSAQLDSRVRGFSYWADEAPLDMRMDSAQTLTAADVVNEYSEADLAAIIARNGEERYARRIAARIVAARPVAQHGRSRRGGEGRDTRARPRGAAATPRGARSRRSASRSTTNCRTSRPGSTNRCTCSRPKAGCSSSRTTRSRTAR